MKTAKDILTQSKEIKSEYCASVVRIGEIYDIPGADRIGKTLVNGFSIVVDKYSTHTGDIMFYASNETVLDSKFLSINNQYELSRRELNANMSEVNTLLSAAENHLISRDEAQKALDNAAATINEIKSHDLTADDSSHIADLENQIQYNKQVIEFEDAQYNKLMNEAKSKVGYFNSKGRVKMITLRKCPSYGFLFSREMMEKYCPKLKDVDLEPLLPTEEFGKPFDFDTVDGKLFIKAYVPVIPQHKSKSRSNKAQKKIDEFDRIIPGEFMLHYDTDNLNKNMSVLSPDTSVTISVKVHGTSAIFSKVKVRVPIDICTKIGWLDKALNKVYHAVVPAKWRRYKVAYGNVYSSRTVIKNQYINESVNDGYYGEDIWGTFNEIFKDYLADGMTVYAEIVGYLSTGKMIQNNYDYGCDVGENKMMPYRITTTKEDGSKLEWEVDEVKKWTENMMKQYPEIANKLMVIPILFTGTMRDLYPDADVQNHWHENVLELMKNEERFGMEKNEPLCKNKVPREGIVLRINNDPVKEAFKLKTNKFFQAESKEIDKGKVDIEMADAYAG